MFTNPRLLRSITPDTVDADQPLFVTVTPTRPAPLGTERGRFTSLEQGRSFLDASPGVALLDYAAFVLDQEARYCQQ